MCLRVAIRSRLAEFRVEEEGEQGHRDYVCGDGLFVIFSHSELLCPYAGVGDEHVDAWQFSLDFVGKGLDRSVRAHVEVPHLEGVGRAQSCCFNVLCCSVRLVDIPTSQNDLGRSEANHPAAGFQAQTRAGARHNGSLALERCRWDRRLADELTVDESCEK